MMASRKKFAELEEKAKAYPFKAITEVTDRIDPVRWENEAGADFMRLPDLKGNNIWHFKKKRDRDYFVRSHNGAREYATTQSTT